MTLQGPGAVATVRAAGLRQLIDQLQECATELFYAPGAPPPWGWPLPRGAGLRGPHCTCSCIVSALLCSCVLTFHPTLVCGAADCFADADTEADPEDSMDKESTLLHEAACCTRLPGPEALLLLLLAAAPPGAPAALDADGRLPLETALDFSCPEAFRLLLPATPAAALAAADRSQWLAGLAYEGDASTIKVGCSLGSGDARQGSRQHTQTG